MLKRQRDEAERRAAREERRKAKAAAEAAAAAAPPRPPPVADTPVAFLFPGQGSQAVGMLKVGQGCRISQGRWPPIAFVPFARCTLTLVHPSHAHWQESADLPAVKKMLEQAQKVGGWMGAGRAIVCVCLCLAAPERGARPAPCPLCACRPLGPHAHPPACTGSCIGLRSQVLGYDLLKLCNEGPKEDLDNTVYSQVGGCGWGRA